MGTVWWIILGIALLGIVAFVAKYFLTILTVVTLLAWLWGFASFLGGPGGTAGKVTFIAITAFVIWSQVMMARQESRLAEEKRKEESEANDLRRQHRDADFQQTPYDYSIGRHAGETLAIRYGIAHLDFGGEPANTIRLQKTKKTKSDVYEVRLTDYKNRRAKAVIEPGTEYVKTFYPLDEEWFRKYADLEETLKGNAGFSLKELATFHVEKVILKR